MHKTHCGCKGVPFRLVRCGNVPLLVEFNEASSNDETLARSNNTGVPIGQIPVLNFKLSWTDPEADAIEVLTV